MPFLFWPVHLYLVFDGIGVSLRVEPYAVKHVELVAGDGRLPRVDRGRP